MVRRPGVRSSMPERGDKLPGEEAVIAKRTRVGVSARALTRHGKSKRAARHTGGLFAAA